MKSESIHRVARALNVKARYDTKIKAWWIGGKTFTIAEVGKMTSTGLRKLFAGREAALASPTETAEHEAQIANGKLASKPKAAVKKASSFDEAAKITLLVVGNPKRKDTEANRIWAIYRPELTVREFLKAGGTVAALRWDIAHKFIALA